MTPGRPADAMGTLEQPGGKSRGAGEREEGKIICSGAPPGRSGAEGAKREAQIAEGKSGRPQSLLPLFFTFPLATGSGPQTFGCQTQTSPRRAPNPTHRVYVDTPPPQTGMTPRPHFPGLCHVSLGGSWQPALAKISGISHKEPRLPTAHRARSCTHVPPPAQ